MERDCWIVELCVFVENCLNWKESFATVMQWSSIVRSKNYLLFIISSKIISKK